MISKRRKAALAKIDRDKLYTPEEGVALAKECATAKFDETVEIHLRLSIDPRHADQQIRSTVMFPHGLGKTVRVIVFAEGDAARAATEAGADHVGAADLAARIQNEGFMDFDVAIATPDMMRHVGRLGRVLGPRGLMPSPKAGTVVQAEDLPRLIGESKAGRIEFRNDRTSNLHVPIGKASFSEQQLVENMATLLDSIRRMRPASVKGTYVRRVVITTTMGPGIRIEPNLALQMQAI